MIRFCSLGSGSSGNATVVEARSGTTTTRLLIDCGFTQKELAARLARRQLSFADLDAVFVTHEHGDHVGCAAALARRHGVALWTSHGTWRAMHRGEPVGEPRGFARDGEAIVVGDLCIEPYTVPHDANEPLQLTCGDGVRRVGVLTDAGMMTAHLVERLQGCDALLLECNHDEAMLAASRYPASLKARISGRLGHLGNATAARILQACVHDGLRHVVAAHLSRENNRPELALAALQSVVEPDGPQLHTACAEHGFDWIELG